MGIYVTCIPGVISHEVNNPSTFECGETLHLASCVGCLNPPCMYFSEDELKLSDKRLKNFPSDVDRSVCPLGAITWESGDKVPKVVGEKCINCGICARRCPFGAIYSNGNSAVIHSGEKEVDFRSISQHTEEVHYKQMGKFKDCSHVGRFLEVNEDSFDVLYGKLSHFQNTSPQMPNLIVRNLLMVVGNKCIISRRGMVYIRIDAIIDDGSVLGIAEVEFNNELLDAPRAILDDIAVLSSRYEIGRNEIKPFVISLAFPNIRSEYWQVIQDISKVLDVEIHSLTFGALCSINWLFGNARISDIQCYADKDNPSIRQGIKALCPQCELPGPDSRGIFEPGK